MDLYGFFQEAVVDPIIDWNRDALKSIEFANCNNKLDTPW